jgi:RNA polymerase sigma-70 factor (ECF subfamily)
MQPEALIMDETSPELMARWHGGDERAAAILVHRYGERLRALARSRLPAALAHRVDADDVVQSAYRSFFTGARAGRLVLRRDGDVWPLLAKITLHKLKHHVERCRAAKRAATRERPFGRESSLARLGGVGPSGGPSPSQAAEHAETIERLCRNLPPLQRRIVELRLHDYRLEEIAAEVRRSERTVRRVLEEIKQRLQRLETGGSGR